MPDTSNLRDRCKYRIWRKAAFADNYALDPTLKIHPSYPITDCVAPEIPSCVLLRPAGYIKEHEDTDFPEVERPFAAYHGQHVKVQSSVDDGTTWETLFVGFIEENTYRMERADFPSGGNRFQCFGYAALLDKRPIWEGLTHNDADDNVHYLEWVPAFNSQNGKRRIDVNLSGNRSTAKVDGIYVFSKEDAEVWTSLDIAEYVIRLGLPLTDFFPTLDLAGQHAALAGIKKYWNSSKPQSLWWWLCQVVDRRYGFGFNLKYTEGATAAAAGTLTVNVFTTTDEDITIGPVTIPANANQTDFSLDFTYPHNHEWHDLEFRRSYSEKYDRIVVRGERILMVATFTPFVNGSWGKPSIEKAWAAALETAYKQASGVDDAQRNDMIRSEDRFEPVYSQFAPPANWPYKVTIAPGEEFFVGYSSDDDGSVGNADETAPWYHGFHHFERATPFHVGKDYSVSPPVSHAGMDPPEFRALFAVVRIEGGRQDGKWAIVDRLSEAGFQPAHIRSLDNVAMGLSIQASPRHAFAKSEMASAKKGEPTNMLFWQTLHFTAAWRLDTRQRVAEDLVDDPDPNRILMIDVQAAEYWKAAPKTVVDVADGELKTIHASELVLRDDVDKLKGVLAAAKAWHEKDRHAVEFNLKTPKLHVALGTMITAVTGADFGSEPVRAVVTRRTISVRENGASCKIETGWNNFDFAGAWADE